MNVAQQIAEYLAERGCKHAFGVVGGANLSVFAEMNNHLDVIPVCHEQAAAIAACAYYKTSGRIAPCLVTNGSGSINALTGVMEAYMDSVPMLVLSGNEMVKFFSMRHSRSIGFQGFDSLSMAQHCTKAAWRALSPHHAVEMLKRLYDLALAPRGGPVWLDIPQDVARAEL